MSLRNSLNTVIIFAFLSVFFLNACDNIKFFKGNEISEGEIIYDIEYLESEADNPLMSILPTEMTLRFKDNSSVGMIEGWLGVFRASYISDYEKKMNSSLLKIMGKKYNNQSKFGDISYGFDKMPGIKIVKTQETKEIAGFKCKKAKVEFPNKEMNPFDIYYTEQIKINNPNWNNPFSEINGVLLEFQVEMRGIRMILKAKSVEQKDIPDEEFLVPEDYALVSKDSLEAVIGEFL